MRLKIVNLRSFGLACLLIIISLLMLKFGSADRGKIVRSLPGFPGEELPFKLETGYVGVGKDEKVQLYYYFVESQSDPLNDPLLFWLTGGPGCSGLNSLIYEIGPFMFDYEAYNGSLPPLISNPNALTKVVNVIFIDAPAGTGYSYSESDEGYNTRDDIDAVEANYQFLTKWLLDHPKFLNNPLYIGGDSYGGKIVPILVHKIQTGLKAGVFPKLNLQGYILGNPRADLLLEESMIPQIANRFGLISDELYESAKEYCGREYLQPGISNALCLKARQEIEKCTDLIFPEHILEPNCKFAPEVEHLQKEGTFQESNISIDNVVGALHGKKPWCRQYYFVLSYIWANDPGVLEALHIRKGTKDYWRRCNQTIIMTTYSTEAVPSVVNYHRSFFNSSIRALIYSGDHDMLVPYISTIKWIASLNLTLTDPWRPWIVDDQAAGYTRTFQYEDKYELTYVTVKGAGHIAPYFKPKQCFEMFVRWLTHSKLS